MFNMNPKNVSTGDTVGIYNRRTLTPSAAIQFVKVVTVNKRFVTTDDGGKYRISDWAPWGGNSRYNNRELVNYEFALNIKKKYEDSAKLRKIQDDLNQKIAGIGDRMIFSLHNTGANPADSKRALEERLARIEAAAQAIRDALEDEAFA